MSMERKALLLEQQQTRRGEAAKIRLLQEPNDSHYVSEISTHCSHSNIPPPSTCSVPTYQEFGHSVEQQCSRRNLLRRTRYAEMSAERKKIMLTQQQARRAEERKSRLSPKPNDTAGRSDVNSQCGQGNITPTSGSSLPTSAGYDSTMGLPAATAERGSTSNAAVTTSTWPLPSYGLTAGKKS